MHIKKLKTLTLIVAMVFLLGILFFSCGGPSVDLDYGAAEEETGTDDPPPEPPAANVEAPEQSEIPEQPPIPLANDREDEGDEEDAGGGLGLGGGGTSDHLSDVLADIDDIAPGAGTEVQSGESGTGYIVDKDGRIIAPITAPLVSYDSANVAFNSPDSMKLGETNRIMLLLSKKLSVTELSVHITEPGEIKSSRIRTSGLMEANLKGKGFQIEPITKSIQKIDLGQEKIEWSWQITALEAGVRSLYLTIDLHTPGAGEIATTTINTLKEEILIYVTWQQRIAGFVSGNWQWLWTTILVPFVGWVYNARKRKKENAD